MPRATPANATGVRRTGGDAAPTCGGAEAALHSICQSDFAPAFEGLVAMLR